MGMPYPPAEDVETADRAQLAEWIRFLESPGMSAVQSEEFPDTVERERELLQRIEERFREEGGWTPELSKRVGWAELDYV